MPAWTPPSSTFSFETGEKSAYRLAAVRQLVLPLHGKLGARQARRRVEKMRIVAEPSAAARSVDDAAVPAPIGEDRLGIGFMADECEHAVVVCPPVGDSCQIGDELFVVARVGFWFAGVARRLDAGRAAERNHANPRVVRESRQSRDTAGMPRLGERVLDEGLVRLLRVRDSQVALRDYFDAQGRKQAAELAQLTLVARGEHKTLECRHRSRLEYRSPHTPSACFCAAMRAPIPCSASASSDESSSREKGCPSAVP